MGYTVKERSSFVATFRWISIQLMETLARWVPTTPEMEVKVLFGRHVWECAQHADALGRRTFELRAPLHQATPAVVEYCELLRDVSVFAATADRVSGFYDILCPGLKHRYEAYIEATDGLMDEPTVRILERAVSDQERMSLDRTRLTSSISEIVPTIDIALWQRRERAIETLVNWGHVVPLPMPSAS